MVESAFDGRLLTSELRLKSLKRAESQLTFVSMAFQLGDIKISGTIDGISFYNSVFGWLLRMKGGPSRKQFKTSPAFVRSRENSSEFTACAKAASAIRRLVITHTGIKDKTLYHRLMKLMRILADNDKISARGHRDPLKGILNKAAQFYLKDFRVNDELSLYDTLLANNYFMKVGNPSGDKDPLVKAKTGSIDTKKRRKTVAFIYRRPPMEGCRVNSFRKPVILMPDSS